MSVGFIVIVVAGFGCLFLVGLIVAAILILTQKD